MLSFFEFLVSIINHYHINGLHLFRDSFEWFFLQISSDAKYFFLSCPRLCDQGLIVVIIYYFQIWNKNPELGTKNLEIDLYIAVHCNWIHLDFIINFDKYFLSCPGSWYNNNVKKHGFDVFNSKDAFFTGRIPNDCHCTCLSNKLLSYWWVASILRHPVC